jgi:Insertion element 4 transposase N-terminal
VTHADATRRPDQASGYTAPAGSDRDRVLTQTFPPELVDRVLTRTGRGEQRQRLLPARVVLY